MYVCITRSFCCTAETDRTLQINYNKKDFLNKINGDDLLKMK